MSGWDQMLLGGTGNDTLRVAAYSSLDDSLLKGDAGNDTLLLDFPSGGNGNVLDGEGSDTLTSIMFYNTLKGGNGADELAVEGYEWTGYSLENTLTGGRGADTYRIGEGTGLNTIREEGAAGETDRVIFTAAAAADITTVQRQGGDLELSDGGERLIVNHFFDHAGYRVERFEFADGTVWTDKQVESLIQSMAAAQSDPGHAAGETSGASAAELSLLLAAANGQQQ